MTGIKTIDVKEYCERLDKFLVKQFSLTRNHAQKLLEQGAVEINGVTQSKPSKSVMAGDVVKLTLPEPKLATVVPQDLPIDVVYQDDSLAVINKQQGLTVHPANGVYTDTLVNALLYHLDKLSQINGVIRPGIVHRLDKDTSGLMVVAKNDIAHLSLSKQIQNKTCRRVYVALLEGVLKEDSGVVNQPIARSKTDRQKMAVAAKGRSAETHWKVLRRYKNYTLAEFELKTGRTHQIRVHAKFLGHPVVGDKKYGHKTQKFALKGQLLHACRLQFVHPVTQQEMVFEAPLPDYFVAVLANLQ